MSWTNICVEGFCGGDVDDKGNYPCGRDCPSHLCLHNGMCPHFGYAEVSERDVAQFSKLRLIIKDRLSIWGERIYWEIRWYLWDCLWFNQRTPLSSFDNIGSVSSKDCSALAEFKAEQEIHNKDFKAWFDVVIKE